MTDLETRVKPAEPSLNQPQSPFRSWPVKIAVRQAVYFGVGFVTGAVLEVVLGSSGTGQNHYDFGAVIVGALAASSEARTGEKRYKEEFFPRGLPSAVLAGPTAAMGYIAGAQVMHGIKNIF